MKTRNRSFFVILLVLVLILTSFAQTGCQGEGQPVPEDRTQTVSETETPSEDGSSAPEGLTPETEGGSEDVPAESGDIVILVTSDVHCGVAEGFGYAGLYAVREQLEAAGDTVLLVDDGDSIQGEAMGTLSRGEAIIELMNQMEYDVAIPGNHEFDYGMERFMELVEMADYPYVSCNFNREGELVLDPYVIIEAGGQKIAFVGVTTPETLTTSTPAYFMDENGDFIYDFMNDSTGEALYAAVQQALDDARAEGADHCVVMGHLGYFAASEPWTYGDVIEHTTGIDVFCDGHSHDNEQASVTDAGGNTVPRVAVGTKMAGIGYVRIHSEDGSIETGLYTWNNEVSAAELLGIENPMSEAVDEAYRDLDELLDTVVATSAVDLVINDPETTDSSGSPIRIVRRAETNLGDLCADAFRDQSGADIAFVNGGGIRTGISAGDVTYGDILSVHPFGNAMCVVEASGQQILDALEWGVASLPSESGGFLQVSGLTYEINTQIESSCTSDESGMFTGVAGEYRVQNVLVGGEPLDLDAVYTLAGSDYTLLASGDGFTMFEGCTVLQERVKIDNQVLIDYITGTLGGVIGEGYTDPYGQGRIVAAE